MTEKLTFDRIRKECVPGKHLLVEDIENKRLYLGFTRNGHLATDCRDGILAIFWAEPSIEDWTIEPYEPPTPPKKLKRYWQWKVCPGRAPAERRWLKDPEYLDESGRNTSGQGTYSRWEEMQKIKIEDDFVDVEE